MPVNHLPEKTCGNGEPHQKDNAEDPRNGVSAHMHMTFVSDLLCDFEDDIEFDRHSERKAGNSDDRSNRCSFDPKDISKEIRDGIRDPGLLEEVAVCRDEHSQPHHARHSIESAQMLLGRGEDAQRRRVGGISSSLDIEFLPESSNKLRLVIDNREHPAKEEQVARLYRLDVRTERRGSSWKLNAKVTQPVVRTARL